MSLLKRFPHYFDLLSVLTWWRILNLLQVETGFLLSRMFRKVIVLGNPWSASIEPTTSCNLRCTECPTGMRSLTRPGGNMSISDFRLIIDKLSPDLFYLTLYFQGEPLLNPHFSEMVTFARSRRIFVSTSTNGHYLNQHNVDEILKSGLNHLVISMDGLDQETYEKYRVNGNLQLVTEGIKRLVDTKKAVRSSTPYVELQFIVFRHNEHQVDQMKEFAKQTGVDKLSFKTAQIYNFDEIGKTIPTLKGKSRYRLLADNSWVPARKIRNRCHRIWSSIVVTWDGKVVPCCYDKNAEFQTGKILEKPIREIWRNQQISAFRSKILSRRSDIAICRNCGE